MKLRVWLKSKVADRVLSPVREELIGLINRGSSLLEVGCGTGDLLFRASSKLSQGVGVDIDDAMIRFAEKKVSESGIKNISFICGDALSIEPNKFDISTSTLCLHELGDTAACNILKFMVNNSAKVLIADFSSTKTFTRKLGIEIDEFFSGHYANYRRYRKNGEIPFYADKIGATVDDVVKTKIDGISIWTINGKNMYNHSLEKTQK